jgi:acetylglutamate kinase
MPRAARRRPVRQGRQYGDARGKSRARSSTPDSNIEKAIDLGFVGEPVKVDTMVLDQVLGARTDPGAGAGRRPAKDGGTFNVNADTFAGAIAGALKAKRLLLLTDVPGVLDKSKKLIKELSLKDARKLIADGTITGRHDPEGRDLHLRARRGVEGVVILDGKVQHAVLLELLTDLGAGTLIHR